MHRHVLTGLLLLMAASCLAIPIPAEGDYDLNYVLSNLTALWEEVAQLRHDVEDHRHGYPPHSQVTQEVDTLQHEMLVHAYQRPHEDHNDHHNPNALQHLEHFHKHHHDDHNHHDGDDHQGHEHGHDHSHDHSHDHGHDHHHGHDHSHDHDHDHEHSHHHHDGDHDHTHDHRHNNNDDNQSDENSREDDESDNSDETHDHDHHDHHHHGGHKNHNHGKGHDHSGDTHDHKSHDHSKDTHQHDNNHHHDHDHTGETHDHEGHDHSQDHSEHGEGHDHSGDVHNHEGHDHSQDAHQHDNDHHHHDDHHHHHHEKDAHDTHGLHDHFEGAPPPASRPSLIGPVLAPKLGLALAPGREQAAVDQGEEWAHASCKLEPNAEMADSTVRGSVIISRKKDESGPVFFHLDLQGFQPSQGRIHGFHIHSSPITDNKCSTAGGHFNPFGTTHGGPDSDTRHVGDLGNIEVDSHGYLENYLLTDDRVALSGPTNIVAKSIVIHAGEDDLGLGGNSGSLTTGNAGGRLACCTIHIQAEGSYRFKG